MEFYQKQKLVIKYFLNVCLFDVSLIQKVTFDIGVYAIKGSMDFVSRLGVESL